MVVLVSVPRLGASLLLALLASVPAGALGPVAASPPSPGVPFSQKPVRAVEPVVLTGSQFPTWSAGPEVTFREPMSPLNSITVNQQGAEPQQAQSSCYDPKGADYGGGGPGDNGDHNCYQDSRLPFRTIPGRKGADPRRILGYRWTGKGFEQIPFQVDQVFTRYLTNNDSGFAFYSGADQHSDYAYDREGFRFIASRPGTLGKPAVCQAAPYRNPHGGFYDGQATTPSPNGFNLVDKDELAFMASDAGNAAPAGATLPDGIQDVQRVEVRDPVNGTTGYVYVMLAADGGPGPRYTADNSPYVHYRRDPNADMFVFSQSSYDNYGVAPKGQYCNADGTLAVDAKGVPLVGQRRALDTAWVTTPNYAFRYDGRWLMTEIRVSKDGKGHMSRNGRLVGYGPNIVDRWKARAFQQAPGGKTPCCGYEEEATNWGGSSQLMGERVGPVRVIRATWGADSSTNNIRRETFYASEVRYADALRVHVIPPLDGIYVQRDMAAGRVDTYYNPYQASGVPIDGNNKQLLGNIHGGFGQGGLCYSSRDQVGGIISGLTGGKPLTVGPPGSDPCNNNDVHGDFAVMDPTFSGPPGLLPWEEFTGDNGTLVERWTAQTSSPGGVAIAAATAHPYFRDDSCFDDGTGGDPGPKLHLRSNDEPQSWWYDPVTHVPTSVKYDASGNPVGPPPGVKLIPRRCWNHEVDGTPYPAGKSDPPPDPHFSPQGDIRYFQGDIATHGLHVVFIADSDNAQQTVPVDELDSEQIQVILPGRQANVGEAYGRSFEAPLVAVVAPAQGLVQPPHHSEVRRPAARHRPREL
jgi:hypothetical protein